MNGSRQSLAVRGAVLSLFILVLLPVGVTVAALFIESSRLTQGFDLTAWPDYSIANAAAKLRALASQGELLSALGRSLGVAILVGLLTAWAAITCAFHLSRLSLGRLARLNLLGYAAYLTPPVVLVISLSWLAQFATGLASPLIVVALGQGSFLFPLNYALALGHWAQVPYAIDRTAASDGANLSQRFAAHISSGTPSLGFFGGLALLTFMLSWSDVLFSRYLLLGEPEQRLLTDLVIESLKANDIVAARGELAAVAILSAIVAAFAAGLYAVFFNRANEVG